MSQKDNLKFDAKFEILVESVEKSLDSDFKLLSNIENEFKTLTNALSEKIKNSCKESFNKLLLFSEKPKEENIENLIALSGSENDFNNAKIGYTKCTNNYKSVLDDIIYKVDVINMIGIHSYGLCLEQCKSEVKNHKLTESDAKNCITTCLSYKKMNASAAYDVIIDYIEETKNFLYKI